MPTRPRTALGAAWLGTGLVLAGCAASVEPLGPERIADAARHGEALVLMRFVREGTEQGIRVGEPGGAIQPEFWNLDTLERVPFAAAPPSAEAAPGGWVVQPLPRGSYVLRLRARIDTDWVVSHDYALPLGADGMVHIGTFPIWCRAGLMWNPPCGPAGWAAVPEDGGPTVVPGVAQPVRTRLVTPYQKPALQPGWPPAAGIGVQVDERAWRAAIDWAGFISRERSRAAFRTAGRIMDTAAPIGAAGEAGAIIATPFLLAALGAVTVGAIHAADEAAQQGRYERRFGSCAERLGAQLTPAVIGPAVQAALADARPAGEVPRRSSRQVAAAAPWQVTLTRVVFRRCDDRTSYGLEVASRWTAPGRRADLLSRPLGALRDPGLTWAEPAPWETVTGPDAPCRSFEAYCAAGGEALVTQDIADALRAGREAILSGAPLSGEAREAAPLALPPS